MAPMSHLEKAAVVGVGVGVGVFVAPPLLGFTAAGSIAATIQSVVYGGAVTAGSWFATMQSIGATGTIVPAVVAGASSAITTLIAGNESCPPTQGGPDNSTGGFDSGAGAGSGGGRCPPRRPGGPPSGPGVNIPTNEGGLSDGNESGSEVENEKSDGRQKAMFEQPRRARGNRSRTLKRGSDSQDLVPSRNSSY
ncbi:hypothetical protein FRC07_008151 [Ceratobasidium sp. 392]|nr:hypothetical protein FRC07_008151 [Ceratobasidium sp. 392]